MNCTERYGDIEMPWRNWPWRMASEPTMAEPRKSIRGWCSACKTYKLVADREGIVSCAHCGAHDLIPDVEARQAVVDGPGLEKFTEQFRREVKAGRR
jgi:hypothetical protein